jgi:hypothetical protein
MHLDFIGTFLMTIYTRVLNDLHSLFAPEMVQTLLSGFPL